MQRGGEDRLLARSRSLTPRSLPRSLPALSGPQKPPVFPVSRIAKSEALGIPPAEGRLMSATAPTSQSYARLACGLPGWACPAEVSQIDVGALNVLEHHDSFVLFSLDFGVHGFLKHETP